MTPSIQLTTPQILTIAEVCQYLTVVDIQFKKVFKGGDLNQRQARLIYIVRSSVQNRYNLNPSDPTLVATGNYLFSLLRNWPAAQNVLNAIAVGLPVITNPANVSITAGSNAVFTVAVTSGTSYTIQWFRNGVAIPGATGLSYTLVNAQVSDSGAMFNAVATNATGNASSLPATLTVSSSLVGYWYQGNTDYSAALLAGSDTVPYNGTFPITQGQPLVVPFVAGLLEIVVVKYPTSQSTKTSFANPTGGIDTGPVPNIAFETNSFGGNNYIFSRNGTPFAVNNSSGQVTFS
jgi:hypothetical protein